MVEAAAFLMLGTGPELHPMKLHVVPVVLVVLVGIVVLAIPIVLVVLVVPMSDPGVRQGPLRSWVPRCDVCYCFVCLLWVTVVADVASGQNMSVLPL